MSKLRDKIMAFLHTGKAISSDDRALRVLFDMLRRYFAATEWCAFRDRLPPTLDGGTRIVVFRPTNRLDGETIGQSFITTWHGDTTYPGCYWRRLTKPPGAVVPCGVVHVERRDGFRRYVCRHPKGHLGSHRDDVFTWTNDAST